MVTHLAYVAAAPLRGGGSGEVGLVPAEYRLLVFDVAAGSGRRIATLGRCTCASLAPAVAWSPDGELVAFTGVGGRIGIYTVPAAGRRGRAAQRPSRWATHSPGSPSSTDGQAGTATIATEVTGAKHSCSGLTTGCGVTTQPSGLWVTSTPGGTSQPTITTAPITV